MELYMDAIPTNDALRVYMRVLRKGRDKTQAEFADAIGLSLRAYTDWERGRTRTVKDNVLSRMVDVLGAKPEHITALLEGSVSLDRAREMAAMLTGTQPDPIDTLIDGLPPDATPDEAARIVKDAMDAISRDQQRQLVQGLRDWLSGWSARQRSATAPR